MGEAASGLIRPALFRVCSAPFQARTVSPLPDAPGGPVDPRAELLPRPAVKRTPAEKRAEKRAAAAAPRPHLPATVIERGTTYGQRCPLDGVEFPSYVALSVHVRSAMHAPIYSRTCTTGPSSRASTSTPA